jgi:2-amino-4-hydroxy-6-hydroxymethyldihydropteridine diphosphokinase
MVFVALRRLQSEDVRVTGLSGLYESPPAEGAGGGYFVNAVAEVHTLLCPEDLLNRLKTIEKSMGRTGGHNRPREIDLDILSLGDFVVESEGLTIPHPRLGARAFVLLPLREVAPGFRCPSTGREIDGLIESLAAEADVSRISDRRLITVGST